MIADELRAIDVRHLQRREAIIREAADTIDRLEAENARLKQECIDHGTEAYLAREEVARLTRERDDALRALGFYAIHAEYDCPGDTPEQCGWTCDICDATTGGDTLAHKPGCLLARMQPKDCEVWADETPRRAAKGGGGMSMKRTPWEIAEAWYDEASIARAIERSGTLDFGAWDKIPEDVYSPEFAKWMTLQYRLAMAKGVQLGRDGSEDSP